MNHACAVTVHVLKLDLFLFRQSKTRTRRKNRLGSLIPPATVVAGRQCFHMCLSVHRGGWECLVPGRFQGGVPGSKSLLWKGMSRGGDVQRGRYTREQGWGGYTGGVYEGVGIPEGGGRGGYVLIPSTWDLRYPPLPLVLTPSGSHHNTYSCKRAVRILECCLVLLNGFCSRSIFPNSEKIKNSLLKMNINP